MIGRFVDKHLKFISETYSFQFSILWSLNVSDWLAFIIKLLSHSNEAIFYPETGGGFSVLD